MTNQSEEKNKTIVGTVIESLPNTTFRVQIDGSDSIVLAYLSGKMRMHRIKVMIGDRVEIVSDQYGSRGRVVKRL